MLLPLSKVPVSYFFEGEFATMFTVRSTTHLQEKSIVECIGDKQPF
jgi:hypothetical protein